MENLLFPFRLFQRNKLRNCKFLEKELGKKFSFASKDSRVGFPRIPARRISVRRIPARPPCVWNETFELFSLNGRVFTFFYGQLKIALCCVEYASILDTTRNETALGFSVPVCILFFWEIENSSEKRSPVCTLCYWDPGNPIFNCIVLSKMIAYSTTRIVFEGHPVCTNTILCWSLKLEKIPKKRGN